MTVQLPLELIQQASADRAAFEELVGHFNGFVLSLARARGVDAATADDIAQDVWQIVDKELARLREPKAFLGWLARVTENTTTHHMKKGTREGELRRNLSERRPAVPVASADSSAILEESHQAVVNALRALPEDYRLPVIMRFYQGMTAREIAEVLDCPLGTILSRLFRANAMLRERLRKHLE